MKSLHLLMALLLQKVHSLAAFFVVSAPKISPFNLRTSIVVSSTSSDDNSDGKEQKTEEEKAVAVGNLVENDEWEGLTMELSELIRTAVIEDVKKNTRDFLGKDDYKLGDFSKELDSRVKSEVANMRGKEVSMTSSHVICHRLHINGAVFFCCCLVCNILSLY